MDPALYPGLGRGRVALTGVTTVDGSHVGLVLDCSGTFALNFTSAATLGNQFQVAVYCTSGTVTIDPAAAETIQTPSGAVSTLALTAGQGVYVSSDGTNLKAVLSIGLAASPSTPLIVRDNAFTITDDGDASKTLVTSLGAMATGVGMVIGAGAQTINTAPSFPPMAATDVIVTTGTAQTITGAKTFSANATFTGNIVHTGAGTLSTATGSISLNGHTEVASNKTLTCADLVVTSTGATGITLKTTSAGAANPAINIFSGASQYWQVGMFGGSGSKAFFWYDVVGGDNAFVIASGVAGVVTIGRPTTIGTIGATFAGNIIAGVQDGTAASSGQVGQVIESVVSTATNAAATGTYLALASITLEGDWLISGWVESIPNGATVTVDGATELVIGTTTASAAGSTIGDDRVTENHPIIAGVRHQIIIPHKRVNPGTATTYYLNVLATFTVGTPQWVGTIRATRQR